MAEIYTPVRFENRGESDEAPGSYRHPFREAAFDVEHGYDEATDLPEIIRSIVDELNEAHGTQ